MRGKRTNTIATSTSSITLSFLPLPQAYCSFFVRELIILSVLFFLAAAESIHFLIAFLRFPTVQREERNQPLTINHHVQAGSMHTFIYHEDKTYLQVFICNAIHTKNRKDRLELITESRSCTLSGNQQELQIRTDILSQVLYTNNHTN